MKKVCLAVILLSVIILVVSCSSENSIKQNESEIKEYQVTDTVTETTETSETLSEANVISENVLNEKEDYSVQDNLYMMHTIKEGDNWLFEEDTAKSLRTKINISSFRESQMKKDSSFFIPGSVYAMLYRISSAYCDGENLYFAGHCDLEFDDILEGFIIKYNISENKIMKTEYIKSHLTDMDYDKNKNQFVIISSEGDITIIDENFKPVMNFSISGKISDDLPGKMRIEDIAVDSSSNIYVCCADRLDDYNDYGWISVSVFEPDGNYIGTSVIKRENLSGAETDSVYDTVLGYIGISSLKEGNAGLFYKKENELWMTEIQSDSTVHDDWCITDDCSDINIFCKCSKSDYLIERKDPESEGTIIETWNVRQDTPDEIHIYPDMKFQYYEKYIPWCSSKFIYGDSFYSYHTEDFNGAVRKNIK